MSFRIVESRLTCKYVLIKYNFIQRVWHNILHYIIIIIMYSIIKRIYVYNISIYPMYIPETRCSNTTTIKNRQKSRTRHVRANNFCTHSFSNNTPTTTV